MSNPELRGSDLLVVLGVPKGERLSWVVWEEGKPPDVVIDLLSDSTAVADKGEKKQIYQDQIEMGSPGGTLLPTYEERARRKADQIQQRADRLPERLRALGIDPDEV